VFHRVTLRATDREASERFYETVLTVLGRGWSDFAVEQADAEVTRGLHIGFVSPSHAEVAEFWRIGTAAGYRDDGAPGPRPQYYGAFLLDPDGNSAEAVHFEGMRRDGLVDHLWIRVADVAASKRFYEALAPRAGFELGTDTPERAQFQGESGSFSVLAGTPTQHMEMAFAASEPAELADPDGNLVKLVAL
jgi:catechol 2,3-dioxygenase-like lactoylglutathione lyase family enzyme